MGPPHALGQSDRGRRRSQDLRFKDYPYPKKPDDTIASATEELAFKTTILSWQGITLK
jgi:hypothetical protein